jgi:hypothetical protein
MKDRDYTQMCRAQIKKDRDEIQIGKSRDQEKVSSRIP